MHLFSSPKAITALNPTTRVPSPSWQMFVTVQISDTRTSNFLKEWRDDIKYEQFRGGGKKASQMSQKEREASPCRANPHGLTLAHRGRLYETNGARLKHLRASASDTTSHIWGGAAIPWRHVRRPGFRRQRLGTNVYLFSPCCSLAVSHSASDRMFCARAMDERSEMAQLVTSAAAAPGDHCACAERSGFGYGNRRFEMDRFMIAD